jgi:hypothetical protein
MSDGTVVALPTVTRAFLGRRRRRVGVGAGEERAR